MIRSLFFANIARQVSSITYAISATSTFNSGAAADLSQWFLSADGALLLSNVEVTLCDTSGDVSICGTNLTLQWTTIDSNSNIGPFRDAPHRSTNNVYFDFVSKIVNSDTCGPMIVDRGCLSPSSRSPRDPPSCSSSPDSDDPVVSFYPLLSTYQNSSCDSQILQYPGLSLSPILSPSGRYIALYPGDGSVFLLQRTDPANLNSTFDTTPVLSIDGRGGSEWWSGPQRIFACAEDACLLGPINNTAVGWWVRDVATGEWQQTAVLSIPFDLLPPEYATCVQLTFVDLSWVGSATDDDAVVMGILWSSGSGCDDGVFNAIVVWSSGLPGVNEGGKNDWKRWSATTIREPYPEYGLATSFQAGWLGVGTNSERNFVVAWTNLTRILVDRNNSIPFDQLVIYRVPVNTTSPAYSAPAVAQTIPCCPPGTLILNASTGLPFPVQTAQQLITAPYGNRFILLTLEQAVVAPYIIGVSQLWSDLDVYPLPAQGPEGYPPWIIPTALGVAGGLLLAGALVGFIVSRVRFVSQASRGGVGIGEVVKRAPTERSSLLHP